jgi:hypothetical protein
LYNWNDFKEGNKDGIYVKIFLVIVGLKHNSSQPPLSLGEAEIISYESQTLTTFFI